MIVIVNGEPKTVNEGTSVQDLIATMELQEQRIAVEVNQEILPRSELANYALQSNDKIEIVHAIGGG